MREHDRFGDVVKAVYFRMKKEEENSPDPQNLSERFSQSEIDKAAHWIGHLDDLEKSRPLLLSLEITLWILLCINVPAAYFYIHNPIAGMGQIIFFLISRQLLFIAALVLAYARRPWYFLITFLLLLLDFAFNFGSMIVLMKIELLTIPGILNFVMFVSLIWGMIASLAIHLRLPGGLLRTVHIIDKLSGEQ